LYVWGFPVQQLLIMAGANTQWTLTASALPLTYLCGWLSWRYIEAPTLSLRRYLPRAKPRRAGRPAPTSDPSVGPRRRPDELPRRTELTERQPAVPAASA
jgi:peptidoglycan/LPS O-acetylase OafA/YrhL